MISSNKGFDNNDSEIRNDYGIEEEQNDSNEFAAGKYYDQENEKQSEENEKYNDNEGDSNYNGINESKQEKEVVKNRKWQWATPLIEGVPPCPRGGHTATLSGASIIIFGVSFIRYPLIIWCFRVTIMEVKTKVLFI